MNEVWRRRKGKGRQRWMVRMRRRADEQRGRKMEGKL